MEHSKYKISGEKLPGSILLEYVNGYLVAIDFELSQPLTKVQQSYFFATIQYEEQYIEKLAGIRLKVEKIEVKTNEKISLFCAYYMKYRKGLKYKVSPADSGKMKHVGVTEKLLTTYFTSDNFLFKNKQSISNYVKYYNEIRAESEAVVKNSRFPNRYDRDFEKKLNPPDLVAYWTHLRESGFKPVKNHTGKIVDWV